MKEKKLNAFPKSIRKLLLCFSVFLLLQGSSYFARASGSESLRNSKNLFQSPQSVRLSGRVTDTKGEPLAGATITQQNTTNATMSDADGKYVLTVPGNCVLHITYMGYEELNVSVKGRSVIHVVLKENAVAMNDVVVTALGIKRQQRSLGYSTTDVKGDEFTQSRDLNLGNALSGKVAGVSVSGNATGAGGSSRVVIRGNASLTGNNQPLYVVDGVPYDNSSLGSAGQYGGMDLGDGLSNLNPDDIADVQVLKGAAASALYGYRGGNGAILITTKSGQKGQALSVEFNNNLTFNSIYDYRDFQKEFGQGVMGARPMTADAAKQSETLSWGERMDGQKAINFLGNPYAYSYVDNWDKFYRTGVDNQTTLSLTGASKHIRYRFGVSNMYDKGILPNSNISQQGMSMNTTYDITSKLHFTVNANYVFEKFQGRTNLGDGNGSTNAALLYHGNSFDIDWLKGEAPGWGADASGQELLSGTNIYFNNPYWLQYKRDNNANKNRLTGAMNLKYDITDWLYVQGSVTRDGYNLEYKQIWPAGGAGDPNGGMTEYSRNFSEMNLNYLLAFNKTFGNWNVGATFGGNRQRDITKQFGGVGMTSFVVHDFPSANNLRNRNYNKIYSEYRVNSIYATADLGFKNQVFLNLTGRNDWFSTLDPHNNHYFYPSVSLSWVFTDTFKLPSWFTFGKLRTSYASASNGTSPYQNELTYQLSNYIVDGHSIGTVNNDNIPNKGLKPVQISEYEVGLNLAFLHNRLSMDAAVYDKNTRDDIALVSTSSASGFSSAIENVGRIENKGIEFMLSGVPVNTKNFTWNSTFNIAYNDSKVKYLGEGVKRLSIDGAVSAGGGNVSVQNIVGQSYGELVGYKYKRVNGQIVYDKGIAQHSDQLENLGSGVYKVTGGWRNDLKYKNISLSILLDFKAGAKIFSGTNYSLYSSGLHKKTLQGRGADGKGTIIGQGVMPDGHGGYVPNNVAVPAQNYWQGIVNNNIGEEFLYDASFIKLRELSVGYTFPKSILSKTKYIKGATISLVARNLWTILKYTDNIDPESAYNASNGQGLEHNGYPATRNVGFNLNVKF